MAELSKTAKRSTAAKVIQKRLCTKCKTGETINVLYTGKGPLRGFRWTCQDTKCGFTEATR